MSTEDKIHVPPTVTDHDGYQVTENRAFKIVKSPKYNYVFRKGDGFFARWGETEQDDPDFSEFGPEIADIEISTICHGIDGTPCRFCYKSNTGRGSYMDLETFKKVFTKLPPTLTQIAFGIGDIDGNPDMWAIFDHCLENEIAPNVTVNGDRFTPEDFDKLADKCGAVAVSHYADDLCYGAVKELTDRGMKQVNIHALLSEETWERCMKLVEDAATDPRLEKLNAIVFLAVKPVGRGTCMSPMVSVDKYRMLIRHAMDKEVGIGFDSCSAPLFLKAMEGDENYTMFEQLAEPCESTCFSVYINTDGVMYPCSFLESTSFQGIDVVEAEVFEKDVWNSPEVQTWREKLLATAKDGIVPGCRQCPEYDLYGSEDED
jgi:MoaA/NifB/PqqE/SkfB family radical SAM enzyme